MADRRPIRASEVGEWAFCQRAWWLHHVQRFEPGNVAARQRGNAAHAAHGATLHGARRLRAVALLLGLVALLLLAAVGLGWL